MGLGPHVLLLYAHLKHEGVFEGVRKVIELGSQEIHCADERVFARVAEAFGFTRISAASSRGLHEALGFSYDCIDLDEKFGAIPLDLNFDALPEKHAGRYDLVTNNGTTEHVLNQFNAFKVMHDLCRPGGLMLHAVPMGTAWFDHGFFNYQPNFFIALAKYNGYQIHGMWVSPDKALPDLYPYDDQDRDVMALLSEYHRNATHMLVVLLEKSLQSREFRPPMQACYEASITPTSMERYW